MLPVEITIQLTEPEYQALLGIPQSQCSEQDGRTLHQVQRKILMGINEHFRNGGISCELGASQERKHHARQRAKERSDG